MRPNSGRIEPGESVDVAGALACARLYLADLSRSDAATLERGTSNRGQVQRQVLDSKHTHYFGERDSAAT